MDYNTRLVELPKNGRLLIFTDLHGNLEDYKKFLSKWDCNDPNCHIVINGDFIHSIYKEDFSVELLEDIIDKFNKYDNFHPILGNHEWSHIANANLYKGTVNQKKDFEKLIVKKKSSLEPYLSNYIDFFKSIPFFVKTENGIFISHAGPSRAIESYEDYEFIVEDDDYYSELVFSVLWARPEKDYNEEDVSFFLDLVKSKVMVVGHTTVDGYEVFGKQLILASSFTLNRKCYLDIDLSNPIGDMDDLLKNIKLLDD